MKIDLQALMSSYVRGLDTLAHVLKKGQEFAQSKGVSESEMLGWRLIDDMHDLRKQVQTTIRDACQWPARAAGLELPAGLEGESSLADLQAAIVQAKSFIASIKPEQLEGRDVQSLAIAMGQTSREHAVGDWLLRFALPNFYFHLVTAYGILRSKGVPVGKMDYLAGAA